MLVAAGCTVNSQNMYGQTPIKMAANAGHKRVVLELMQSSSTPQTNTLLRGIDKCENSHHTNVFLNEITTKYRKLYDFGMNQYFTSSWHSKYYNREVKCDIE